MKPRPFHTLLLSLAAAGAWSGCTQFSPVAQTRARIQEKNGAYTTLSVKQQGDIQGGAIERGNTKDMVYMALGRPQKIVTSADGIKEMWVFVEHYAAGPDITTGFNSPNSSHYFTGLTGSTAPPGGNGPSTRPLDNSTINPAFMQVLAPAEMKTRTVYVFFSERKVVEIKLDGDAADQMSTALNKIPFRKPGSKFPFPRSAYGGFDE